MLPYPSGEPHVGHLKCYAVGDAIAHFRRRHGFQVIHPMGYDAFGLPAENNAIQTGEHPRVATERSIADLPRAVPSPGASRSTGRASSPPTSPTTTAGRSGSSCSLFERGLAYRTEAPVQWCPKDATVLANEQVIDGRCERCGTPVEHAQARAVVLPHHRLRRPPARRLRAARVLARARRDDAAQLDRPLRGRRGRLPLRRARARLPRLHHPPRHPLRRHLLRPRPRAPRARAPDRRHRRTRPRCATTSTQAARAARPRSAAPRTARRPASRSAAPSPTPSTASRSRCSSPTTC